MKSYMMFYDTWWLHPNSQYMLCIFKWLLTFRIYGYPTVPLVIQQKGIFYIP